MLFTSLPCDMHMHSSFSEDSDTPMEEMIRRAVSLGIRTIAFTEHIDYDYHPEDGTFLVDLPAYRSTFLQLKETFRDQIELLFGAELGMQSHLSERYAKLAGDWPFDYLIASQHLVFGRDPYYGSFWENRDEASVLQTYFSDLYQNLKALPVWDTCAHLDYIIRYLPSGPASFVPENYLDQIEPILQLIIDRDKTLEVNTAPLARGMQAPNPSETILQLYYSLGGRRVTLGSDAHVPAGIGCMFDETARLLKKIGFTAVTCYRAHNPCEYLL